MKGSYLRTDEHKRIISEAIKKKYLTDESYRKRAGGKNKGRVYTKEQRLAQSLRMKGRISSFLGKKHKTETLEKMRLSRLGKPNLSIKGEKHPRWKGGRIYDGSKGYVRVYSPDHPFKSKTGYVSEHRLVMEKSIGRYLNSKEVVHHKNGIKDDNRIENLLLFSDSKSHITYHRNIEKMFLEYLSKNEKCLQYPL